MKSKLKFIVGTHTTFENNKIEVLSTKYTINVKIDGVLFTAALRFNTQEAAEVYIESLRSFLKQKPKQTKLLLENPN